MMNNNMNKIMTVICAVGAAIVSLVMICFEIMVGHVPALAWFVFSMLMFAFVSLSRTKEKQASSDWAK